jgi:hypothetical protein
MKTFALAAALALTAAPAFAAQQIHVIEHPKGEETAHVGKAADNRGDILTFANDVFDAADKAKVGHDQGVCFRIAVGKSSDCFWTLFLADGQITVEGPFYDAGDSTLAVTGGTGKYAGARGEMKLHARNPKQTEFDFLYSLQ